MIYLILEYSERWYVSEGGNPSAEAIKLIQRGVVLDVVPFPPDQQAGPWAYLESAVQRLCC